MAHFCLTVSLPRDARIPATLCVLRDARISVNLCVRRDARIFATLCVGRDARVPATLCVGRDARIPATLCVGREARISTALCMVRDASSYSRNPLSHNILVRLRNTSRHMFCADTAARLHLITNFCSCELRWSASKWDNYYHIARIYIEGG